MDSDNRNVPSRDNRSNSSDDYLVRASSAVAAGDKILGIHLYLAAFERAKRENLVPSDESLEGMEKAWSLAVDTGQRSLAEYIFEHLEPYWNADEMARHADQLQQLALDKLEEFGLSREALEEMAEMLNQDLSDLSPELLYRFEEADDMPDFPLTEADIEELLEDVLGDVLEAGLEEAETDEDSATLSDGDSAAASGNADAFAKSSDDALDVNTDELAASTKTPKTPAKATAKVVIKAAKNRTKDAKHGSVIFDYSQIAGFDSAIADMGKLGIGRDKDPNFKQFVTMLNERHGLSQMPSLGTVIFKSPSSEDANYFMMATVGELKLPAVRMRLEQNTVGQPVLCIMTSSDFKPRINNLARMGFVSPAVLVLEDLDTWDFPEEEDFSFDDPMAFFYSQVSRGAREALGMIRSAMENPEVTVLISATHPEEISEVFLGELEQHRTIDIGLPDEQEREAVWRAVIKEHPSLGDVDLATMVEFSASLSRHDIVDVASDAVEHAYRRSIEEGSFVPVLTDDILTRLANYQPLDSDEYSRMEQLVIEDFKKTLGSLDDILNQ